MSTIGTKEGSSFQLKADFIPITVLKLSQCDLQSIAKELDQAIASAPKYFTHAPVIVDILNLGPLKSELDVQKLCQLLRDKQIIPVGIRGIEGKQKSIAIDCGLAVLKTVNTEPEAKPVVAEEKPKKIEKSTLKTKIVTKPIRSGSRVYAKNADLIITAAVNSGGEVIADGNIHIYGPLRGRALAGASGDTSARIFCQELDAELISIAGHYIVKENIQAPKSTQTNIQIFLDNEKLTMEGV